MHIEAFRDWCISKTGVTEELPFGPSTLVFKVMNKMFALCDIEHFESFNAKCDPDRALELRAVYSGIRPGYHMSKIHWNTIETNGSVPNQLMFDLLDHSYDLVAKSLPKKDRLLLEEMTNEIR
jgi:predicted DNA-binding protein (MmcQ/YjbR family)